MTNVFAIVMISSIALFFLSIITLLVVLVYKVSRRTNVHATLFLKSGGQEKVLWNRKKDGVKKVINGKEYLMEEGAIRKTAYRDFIYFKEDQTRPLYLDEKEINDLNPKELKEVLENDLIEKLFSNKDIQMIKTLVIVALVLIVIVMLISILGAMSDVTIKNSAENFEFIKNATRSAITGL